MSSFLLYFLLLASFIYFSYAAPTLEIVNGTTAVPHSFPFLAYLSLRTGQRGIWLCVGTLVSPNYILTSAGCLDEATELNITLGLQTVSNATNEGKFLSASPNDIVHHSRYVKGYMYGNIALVKLNETLSLNITGNDIKVANLANASYIKDEFVGENCNVSGWGYTDTNKFNSTSDVLLYATVKVVSNDDCMDDKGFYIDNTIMCTKLYHGGPCLFDTGGPLIMNNMVVGLIFSEPIDCSNPARTTMFTRIPNYIDWITENSDVQDNQDYYYY